MKEQIFNLQMKLNENSDTYKIAENIDRISDDLKQNVTLVAKLMDEEKKKLHQIVGYIEEKCDAIERNIRDSARHSTHSGVLDNRNSFGKKYSPTTLKSYNNVNTNALSNMGIDISSKPFEMNQRSSPNFRQHMENAEDDETLFHSINCEYDIFDEVSKSFIQNPISKKNTLVDQN